MSAGDDGGILRVVRPLGALPEDLAGGLVEGGHGARSAGGADDLRAVDEHAFGVTPARNFATERTHGGAPEFLAIRDLDADEGAVAAEGVNVVAIDGRRAPRANAPILLRHGVELAELVDPEFLAGIGVEAEEDFRAVARAHGEEFAAGDGEAGIAAAGIGIAPDFLRAFGRPLLEQAGFFRDVIAIRAAELGPVEGGIVGADSGGKQGADGEEGDAVFHDGKEAAGDEKNPSERAIFSRRHGVWRAGGGREHPTPNIQWRNAARGMPGVVGRWMLEYLDDRERAMRIL